MTTTPESYKFKIIKECASDIDYFARDYCKLLDFVKKITNENAMQVSDNIFMDATILLKEIGEL